MRCLRRKASECWLPLLATICICCVGNVSAQTAGEGTAFTLTLPYLTPSTNGGAEQISLLLTSQQGSSVTVRNTFTGAVRSVFVPANSFTQLNIDTANVALPYAEGMFRKSLQVQADNPITATVMLDRGTASEAYTAIADSLLGLEYISVGNLSLGPGSFMVVAATEDHTTVTITPNITTRIDGVAGVPFTIQLNKGEVYQLLTKPRLELSDDDDLTGTHIVADRPVAVWSGVTCSRLPIGNETCGPLIEQLPSIDMFGTRHLLGLYSGERLTYWRAVSLCRDTRITSSELLPEVDTTHARLGRTTTRPTVQNGEIISSEKALVVHLGVNVSGAPPRYVDSAVGDPTMGLVVPVEQMASRHHVVVPDLAPRIDGGLGVFWKHSIHIARSSPTDNVTLNGLPVPFVGNYAVVEVVPRNYRIEAEEPVSVTVHGRSVSDAYTFVSAPVVRTLPLHADSIVARICGDEYDATFQLQNATNADIVVDEVEFLAGLEGEFLSPTFPFTVPAGDEFTVRLRLKNLQNGVTNASIVFRGGTCRDRVARIPVDIQLDKIEFQGAITAGELRFPTIRLSDGSVDATVALFNPSSYAVRVLNTTISPAQFSIVAPAFPITIPPNSSEVVNLRFTPQREDVAVFGKVVVHTEGCPNDSLFALKLRGDVQRIQLDEPPVLQYLCEPKESDTLRVMMVNQGEESIQVNQVILDESDVEGEFLLLDGTQVPRTLQPNDTLHLSVRYLPGRTGSRQAGLRIVGAGIGFDTLHLPLRVQNDLALVVPEIDALDLGVRLCDVDSFGVVRLFNKGTVSSHGINLSLLDGSVAQMNVDLPDELPPGDSVEIKLSVADNQYGSFFDTLRVVVPSCGLEYLIPVQGRCAVGRVTLAWSDKDASPGSPVSIPLTLDAVPPLFAVDADVSVRLVTRVEHDLLLTTRELSGVPEGMTVAQLSEYVEGNSRMIEIELRGRLPTNGVLAVLDGVVLLGSKSFTSVTIDSLDFRFLSDVYDAEITKKDGSLTINGICNVGSARLVDVSGEFALRVAPNPIADNAFVEMSLVEDGPVSLRLLNNNGEQVLTIINQEVQHGLWQIEFPVNQLPSGVYYLHLLTRTQSITAPVYVVQ